jgi:ABC-type glycerol-3-phosphate transport system substrate-binding protein
MAITFAQYFSTPAVQQLMGDVGGGVPGNYPAAAGKVSTKSPLIKSFSEADHAEIGYLDSSGYVQKPDVDFFTIMTSDAQKLLFKSITVDQFVTDYNNSVDYSALSQTLASSGS